MYGFAPYGAFPYAEPLFPAASAPLALQARGGTMALGRPSAVFAAAFAAFGSGKTKATAAGHYAIVLSAVAPAAGTVRTALFAACALGARAAATLRGAIGNNLLQLTARAASAFRAMSGAGYGARLVGWGYGNAVSPSSALRIGGLALAARAALVLVGRSLLRIGASPMPPLIDQAAPPQQRLSAPGGTLNLSGPTPGTSVKATDTGPLKG
jgi:hypothetical protein